MASTGLKMYLNQFRPGLRTPLEELTAIPRPLADGSCSLLPPHKPHPVSALQASLPPLLNPHPPKMNPSYCLVINAR